jgi:putative tryptophan/tyrosine transport system substrate-binding protein
MLLSSSVFDSVDRLARPGGNITGVVFQQLELTAKRLELLKETVPAVTRIAVFWDVISADQLPAAEAAAKTLGVTLLPRELRQPPYDFAGAFRDITQANAEALMVLQSPLMSKPRQATLPNLAIQNQLPAIFGSSRYVAAGGLMSYGVNFDDLFRRAATYVDRILQGTQPGELPVERPTTFELVVNLKTAKQLGVTMPSYILYKADKVIR